MTKAFASMSGEEILTYVRDTVINVAVNKRSFAEQSAAVGGTPLGENELKDLAALDAAGGIVQFVLTVGQDARTRGKSTPEWVLKAVAQARSALVAENEEANA